MSEEAEFWGEETEFWGVVVPPGPAHQWLYRTAPLPWPGPLLPNGKPVPYYPLFSSKEKAEEFVRERGQDLMVRERQQLVEEALKNIRRIYRDELPDDHYVNLDGGGLVTWGEL
jgi:hypothetical protein